MLSFVCIIDTLLLVSRWVHMTARDGHGTRCSFTEQVGQSPEASPVRQAAPRVPCILARGSLWLVHQELALPHPLRT